MSRPATALLAAIVAAATLPAFAQAPTPPLFSTTKVEGTDGVYIFRYQGHQAMFVVTPDGVIATDPIGERRPAAAACDACPAANALLARRTLERVWSSCRWASAMRC